VVHQRKQNEEKRESCARIRATRTERENLSGLSQYLPERFSE
jgi:hypothetical protein